MEREISGGCLCGACRYATNAEPINVRACHCRMCQNATGAPFYARVMVPLDSVGLNGPIGWFNSSPGMRRGFCLSCGTTLFSERVSANTMGLTMGSLDEPDAFAPTEHIWTSSMQAWLRLDDGLVQYPTTPPA